MVGNLVCLVIGIAIGAFGYYISTLPEKAAPKKEKKEAANETKD